MKKLKQTITFALLSLLGVESFFFFDLSDNLLVVIPSSLALAATGLVAIHLYRLLFDKEYQWTKIKRSQRHHKKGYHKHHHDGRGSHSAGHMRVRA
jgi:hypothetical protein